MTGDSTVIAIVQARVGSTRLPGKVLADLGGRTVLARVVTRLRRARLLDDVVIATSVLANDDAIARECERLGTPCVRGSEDDVLERYYRAAKSVGADAVARITSDCPLIDPQIVDETISALQAGHADYASNIFPRRYPRGLDVEVFTATALAQAWEHARESHQREHVTPYFYENPGLFRLVSTKNSQDHSQYRWTLDTREDLELIRSIYLHFGNRDDFSWEDALELMKKEPQLAELNSHVTQKVVGAS